MNLVQISTAEEAIEDGRAYPKRIYQTNRVEGVSPKIDGVLDEACWEQGEWSGRFLQRHPNEAASPEDQTELKIVYDDQAIYVAIRAFEKDVPNRDKQIGRRDSFEGDMVGIAFDSYFDHRTAFEFNVTGGGSKVDLLIHPNGFDRNWNAVWDVAVGEEANAWVAEYRIPFSQLRFSPNIDNRVWGLHCWRDHRFSNMESNWQVIPRDNSGFVYQFGELHGLENINPKRQIEILPYLSGAAVSEVREDGNPFKDGTEFEWETGLDAKIGVTNNLIVDLTINPDFGQVESDPSELNLGTVETFFREQRPFFLEGKSLFDYNVDGDMVFYSRRIGRIPQLSVDTDGYTDFPKGVRILGAAKLTGKTQHGLSVGSLFAVADEEQATIYEDGAYSSQTVEPMTKYAVSRLTQEFNEGGTTFGGIVAGTIRDLDDGMALPDKAITGGADFMHRWWNRSHFFRGRFLWSHVSGDQEAMESLQSNNMHNFDRVDATHVSVDPTLETLTGWGGNVEIGKDNGGNWRWDSEFDWRSPGLELNDVGFQRRTDSMRFENSMQYVDNNPGNHFKSQWFRATQRSYYTYEGESIRDNINLQAGARLNSNWNLRGTFSASTDFISTDRLRGGPSIKIPGWWETNFRVSSDGSKDFIYWASVHMERSYERGGFIGFWPGFEVKRGSRFTFNFNLGYFESDFDAQWMNASENADGLSSSYFLGQLERETFSSTIRLDYNFTPDMSLVYYGNVYLSSGLYNDYKIVTDPRAGAFDDRFHTFTTDEWYRDANEDLNFQYGSTLHTFDDPDFNYRTFRSNLVFRWEYKPGSTLYVVWSHHRQNSELDRDSRIAADFNQLVDAQADNTLLVKASYWFSI